MSVERAQRHLKRSPCPICQGYDEAPRGSGQRCHGFTSKDGYAHCARDEMAGGLDQGPDGLYAHRPTGACKCGVTHAPAGEPPDVEATYVYRDEGGALLFEVLRKAGKRFLQRRPLPDGSWEWRTAGTRMVLYRLPELLAAGPASVVWIVEGEKDADAGARAGLVTTCNPRGAGKWKAVAELARTVLAGRTVVVVADKDEPGRRHARDVAESLRGVASVRVVEAPGDAKDLAEHLGGGGAPDQMADTRAGAPSDGLPDDEFFGGAEVIDIKSKPKKKKEKAEPPEGAEWETGLVWKATGDGGYFAPNLHNIATVLTNTPEFAGVIAFDEFGGQPLLTRACPVQPEGSFPVPWADIHDKRIAAWLQRSKWALDVSLDVTSSAIELVARAKTVHPLREKLSSFVWDGTSRISTWLTSYLGAIDSPYLRDVGEKWLISMVARAFEPGCKVDHVLVLEGKQRALKSTALRILGIGFFTDEIPDLGTKDAAIHLQGVWLVEMAELDTLDRATQNRIKAFVTRTIDRYRGVWGRHAADHPRQCGFAGSTNERDYLQDPTGGRRWWPVEVGTVNAAALERDVGQLWAEALLRYQDGAAWWLTDEEAHARAAAEQEDRYQGDVWHEKIAQFVKMTPVVSIADVLQDLLDMKPRDQGRAEQMRVAKCLKILGFERKRAGTGSRVYVYERPEQPVRPPESVRPPSDLETPPNSLF